LDVSKQRGLPTNRRMRHDQHFVDNLVSAPNDSIGRMIPIDQLIPNPDQPRKMFGDIADLVSSIKEKGILEPVLVRPAGEKFQIIAGERRYRASLQAGLSQVPCIELDVDDRGVLEISLIENLQRLDLDPFEEADGLQKLSEKFLYTHEEIAKKLGKSRTSITETLSLNNIPVELRGLCREAGISTRSTLLQVARLASPEAMAAMITEIRRSGLTRDDVRRMKDKDKQQAGRPKGFLFRFKPSDSKFFLNIRFRRSEVSKDDIIQTLRDLIDQLQKS
jgi:ParB family chromosome partitioning protein